jgi:hypothetical protein
MNYVNENKPVPPGLRTELGLKLKRCVNILKSWPSFYSDAASWQHDVAELDQQLQKAQSDLAYNDLKIFIDTVVEEAKGNEKLIAAYAGEDKVAKHYAQQQPNPSESYADFMFRKVIRITLATAKTVEKNMFNALSKAGREKDDATAKYKLLLDALRPVIPAEIEALEARITKADELKAKEKAGDKVVAESYESIFFSIIPQALARKPALYGIFKVLVSLFPEYRKELEKLERLDDLKGVRKTNKEDLETRAAARSTAENKLVEHAKSRLTEYAHTINAVKVLYDAVDLLFPAPTAEQVSKTYAASRKELADILKTKENPVMTGQKLAVFIQNNLATRATVEENAERIADQEATITEKTAEINTQEKVITEYQDTFYNLIRVATGKEPDLKKFDKDPVGYVKEAVAKLQSDFEVASAEYVPPEVDPFALVKQAYAHHAIGAAYTAAGEEELAKEQFEKVKKVLDDARDFFPITDRAEIDKEIAAFEKYTGAENG